MTSVFTGLSPASAPSVDELQVAVLGRGVGESIVVHIGGGRWVVVDSFLVQPRPQVSVPAAVPNLQAIGVHPSAVVAVAVSHFDVDHVRGITDVLRRSAPEAELVLSGAMAAREFLAQLRLQDRPGEGGEAGLKELRKLIELVPPAAGATRRRLVRCRRDQALLRRLEKSEGAASVFIYGMAPSEDTIRDFLMQVAPVIDGPTPATLPKPLLNRASAALHLQVGSVAVLLCGDLEEDERAGCEERGGQAQGCRRTGSLRTS